LTLMQATIMIENLTTLYFEATISIFAYFGLSGILASTLPSELRTVGSFVSGPLVLSNKLGKSDLLGTSSAPRIARCLIAALIASYGGMVTKGNFRMSFTPIDLSCKTVWSSGDFNISGLLNWSILPYTALEKSL
jgi:hypothetical protein